MSAIEKHNQEFPTTCPHKNPNVAQGLVVIAIEDPQHSFLGNFCSGLADPTLENICRYIINAESDDLATYLKDHKAAIIIDSAADGCPPGTVSLMDLGAMVEKSTPLRINSRHGFYLARQLRHLKKSGGLPHRILFFAVGSGDLKAGGNGSGTRPGARQSPKSLTLMIDKAAQALSQHA